MKTTKRTEITIETFEKIVIRFNRIPMKVVCENCKKPIFELPITKIALAQPVSESEDVYLFMTESGFCFFFEIL